MPNDVRKQVYRLSSQDLLDSPIWEFCSDEEGIEGQDEATVKPSDDTEVPGYSPGAYVVAADITYADGARANGYLYSSKPDDFVCVSPTILLPTGQINLWAGSLPFVPKWKEHLANDISLLRSNGALFPMLFESRANVNGAPLTIVVEGFLARDLDGRMTKIQ